MTPEQLRQGWERDYGPGSYGRAHDWIKCRKVFQKADAKLAGAAAEADEPA